MDEPVIRKAFRALSREELKDEQRKHFEDQLLNVLLRIHDRQMRIVELLEDRGDRGRD